VSVVILDWNTMLPLLILNRGDQREVRQREAGLCPSSYWTGTPCYPDSS
jgi:hypothetical protein